MERFPEFFQAGNKCWFQIKVQVKKSGYLVLEFLEHQRVWFFQYLLIEPGLSLDVDL